MIFLPIVERELRVAARRRGTYWSRLLMAGIAMGIGLGVLIANFGLPETTIGQYIFRGLAGLSLLYCVLAGRHSTADCLSEEKREGTLGLLFLTDLKGYDVVLGKLAATSVTALYGLFAVFPVLAIPLLMGGVSYGEFGRLILVLLDTFFFSLAVGIFSSALARDLRNVMAINFNLLFFFVAIVPCGSLLFWFGWHIFIPGFCFTSPIYAGVLLFSQAYKSSPQNFWLSLAVIHGLTWILLIAASCIVPHSWQDRAQSQPRGNKPRPQGFWHRFAYGPAAALPAHRKNLLDVNAFYWLASRMRLKPLHVWIFILFLAGWRLCVNSLSNGVLDDALDSMTALLLNSTLKLWLMIEAGQQLSKAKNSGALELLLSTPLDERNIIRGQMLALRRQFLWPTVAVMFFDVRLLLDALSFLPHPDSALKFIWIASIVMLPIDLVALAWVAMGKSLTSKSYNNSIIATAFRIFFLPWILFGLATVGATIWIDLTAPIGTLRGFVFHPGWFFAFSLLADLYFAWRANDQLSDNLRHLASQRFTAGLAKLELKPKRPSAKIPRRTLAFRVSAGLALVIALISYVQFRSAHRFPPPIVVPMNFNHRSLQVVPGGMGALLLMPDGTVWRYGLTGGFGRTALPQPIGTNHWLMVSGTSESFRGIRNDGTLWEQTSRGGAVNLLSQMGKDHDWVGVASSGWHGFAIKHNGTLWAWGENQMGQLGIGPGPLVLEPEQVGAGTNWSAIFSQGNEALGLRTDGTLWGWGRTLFFNGFATPIINDLPYPTQLCSDTNWTGFPASGATVKVSNTNGELWEPFASAPDAATTVDATCRLAYKTTRPLTVAFGYCGELTTFEIRTNRTLWRRTYMFGSPPLASTEKWEQVGRRFDWLSLWGVGGAVFGLTGDGTLWTWGYDFSREEQNNFNANLQFLHLQFLNALGRAPVGARMGMGRNAIYQFEKNPHAILHFVPDPLTVSSD